jgi:hypothetical protein
MRGIHKCEHFTHQAGSLELSLHGGKRLREPSRPNLFVNGSEEAVIGCRLRLRKPIKSFRL